MAKSFQGFPKDLFKFLTDLKANNDRDWFNASKPRYRESVVEPMSAFITAMDTGLAKVSDCFIADPRPHGGSMFRIYRDTRFSHDKNPYKEHVACQFRHMAGKSAHAPGFYVHLAPDEVLFGGGIWMPDNSVLNEIRTAIVDDSDRWKKVSSGRAFRNRFGGVRGDGLKRPPKGFDPDHPFVEDLKRKSFFAMQEVPPKMATTPDFIKEVQRAFVAMAPFMQFLTDAVGVSFSLDE